MEKNESLKASGKERTKVIRVNVNLEEELKKIQEQLQEAIGFAGNTATSKVATNILKKREKDIKKYLY